MSPAPFEITCRSVPRWYGDDSPHLNRVGLPHGEQARLVKTVKVCVTLQGGARIRPSVPARGNLGGPSVGSAKLPASVSSGPPDVLALGIAIDWVTGRSSLGIPWDGSMYSQAHVSPLC